MRGTGGRAGGRQPAPHLGVSPQLLLLQLQLLVPLALGVQRALGLLDLVQQGLEGGVGGELERLRGGAAAATGECWGRAGQGVER
jgi:hypothetical protein